MSCSATGVAFLFEHCDVGLWLLHASPAVADTDHGLATANGRPIPREAREGSEPPALASYLSARSRRRFL